MPTEIREVSWEHGDMAEYRARVEATPVDVTPVVEAVVAHVVIDVPTASVVTTTHDGTSSTEVTT